MESAYSIDPDQPKHTAQANPDRHYSPPVDFLFRESLHYTSHAHANMLLFLNSLVYQPGIEPGTFRNYDKNRDVINKILFSFVNS